MTETRQISKGQTTLYATGRDFCRIFEEDMNNLYLLSILLTADAEQAEQCFVSGLDDCASGNQVFKEWARSWARRAIIKNAIRLMAPDAVSANDVSNSAVAAGTKDWARPELQLQISALSGLQPFERFAFVMSILEGYSDRECTLLLGCTRESLIAARVRALQQMAGSVDRQGSNQADASRTETLRGKQGSVIGLAMPVRLATPA